MRFRYGAHFCCLYRILLSQDGSSGCTNVYMKACGIKKKSYQKAEIRNRQNAAFDKNTEKDNFV